MLKSQKLSPKFKFLLKIGVATTALCCISACSGGGGNGGGSSNKSCFANSDCVFEEFCNFEDFSCGASGAAGMPGHCTLPRTLASCQTPAAKQRAHENEVAGPVCSCSGFSFDSQCFAESAGESIRAAGQCS